MPMRPTVFSVAVLLGLACVVISGSPAAARQAAQTPQRVSALDLLDHAGRGEYDAALRAVTALLNERRSLAPGPEDRFVRLGRELDAAVVEWIAVDPVARERRSLIASTLLLEGSGECLRVRYQLASCIDWLNVGLRARQTHPAADFDRLWYLAALSVVEGTRDANIIEQFVKLSRASLSNEPETELALARTIELRWPDRSLQVGRDHSAKATSPEAPLLTRTLPYRAPASLPRYSGRSIEADLTAARRAFERVREQASVRAEATLRLGRVASRLHEDRSALEYLGEARQFSGDSEIVHLSHLIQGEIYERTGRRAEAIQAYRAALSAMPGGRTATMALADLLLETGARQEGAALSNAARKLNARDDPWYRYLDGGMRHWAARMARVREALGS
jgi:tetratricopeptide (TPR) repeat protein